MLARCVASANSDSSDGRGTATAGEKPVESVDERDESDGLCSTCAGGGEGERCGCAASLLVSDRLESSLGGDARATVTAIGAAAAMRTGASEKPTCADGRAGERGAVSSTDFGLTGDASRLTGDGRAGACACAGAGSDLPSLTCEEPAEEEAAADEEVDEEAEAEAAEEAEAEADAEAEAEDEAEAAAEAEAESKAKAGEEEG